MNTTDAAKEKRERWPKPVMALDSDQLWRHDAACRWVDPELFHPAATSGVLYDAQVAKAKAVCRRCPAQTFCLEEALARGESGIWGGTTEEERKQLRRNARAWAS